MRKLSNRAVLVLAVMGAGGVAFVSAGFGPASWEGRKRLVIDGEYRDTLAELLDDDRWRITCVRDKRPCEMRAEAVCGGGSRVVTEEVSDKVRRELRFRSGLPPSEGGPVLNRVVECLR